MFCKVWINSQRWWYMGHDRLSIEVWRNVCKVWINNQRWWYMGHDRLSMEGWRNVCVAWVKLINSQR